MAFLKIMSGSLTGTKYDIDKDETSIGRVPENVFPLNEPAVSGKHCVIIRDGKKFTLRDVGSTNGTRLNEQKITESRLKPKDIIVIGSVEMMFDGEDIEIDPSAPKLDLEPPKPQLPASATGIRRRTVVTTTPGTFSASPSVGAGAPFDRRKEHKAVWIALLGIIGVLALVAFALFLYRLFKL